MAGIKGKPVAVAATERRRLVVLGNVPADWSPLPGVPASRTECIDGPRPCRWIRCRLHLWRSDPWDQPGRRWPGGPRHGKVKAPTPATCALDVTDADPDGLPPAVVGALLGVTAERIRQIERAALAKLQPQVTDGEFPAAVGPSPGRDPTATQISLVAIPHKFP